MKKSTVGKPHFFPHDRDGVISSLGKTDPPLAIKADAFDPKL